MSKIITGRFFLKDAHHPFAMIENYSNFFNEDLNCYYSFLSLSLFFLFSKHIKGKGGYLKDSFETLNSQNSLYTSICVWEIKCKKYHLFIRKVSIFVYNGTKEEGNYCDSNNQHWSRCQNSVSKRLVHPRMMDELSQPRRRGLSS